MKRISFFKSFIFVISVLFPYLLAAQMSRLYGTDNEWKDGIHDGNQFRTSFWNDGTWGRGPDLPGLWAGEWPINSGHLYLIDGNTFVISEVYDNYDPINKRFLSTKGTIRHIQATVKSAQIQSSSGDSELGPPNYGKWWTFLPLPGFSNPNNNKIAMAKGGREWEEPSGLGTWPPYWPDIKDPLNPIYSPDGWAGSWNGYFGRNKFNADQESYFVADDYQKQEFPTFRPDTNNVSRGGIGMRTYQRGFQWSKGLVQDALFNVIDIENIGTYNHTKVVFGYKIGNNVGDTKQGGEAGDDGGSYNVEHNLAWTWDNDGRGAATWGTTYGIYTGVFGGCFLESPGNPFDGIDNDNDGKDGSGPVIDLYMFTRRTLSATEPIILIDYESPTYRRIKTTLADTLRKLGKSTDDTLVVILGDIPYKFYSGKVLEEIGHNLFDDNLNGIIDENRGVTINNITHYIYLGRKYIDYFTGDGKDNSLIDERRDDGIDNNGNWDVTRHDLGADGLGPNDRDYPGPDQGEGDGRPSPGEPHFDKTDINESDMIGLTSFNLYTWSNEFCQYDDEKMWETFTPGYFKSASVGNVELSYGAGYFPMPPGRIERFSIGLIAAEAGRTGKDTAQLFRTKYHVARAYEFNYNFAKAPDIPSVRAVAGDKRVVLFWDDRAEYSIDPMSADSGFMDFEGYKIYRSTDPGWNDCEPITDGYGKVIFRKPIAQFDKKNGIKGFATVPTNGVLFYLGDDTGLRHFWIDNNVKNGTTYYYAVTSYDHGNPAANIDPSECTKFIAVQHSGVIQKGPNVAVVRPEAPAAGYVPPHVKDSRFIPGPYNTTTGTLDYRVLDHNSIKGGHSYQVTFKDTTYISKIDTNQLAVATKSLSLINITTNDTLLENHPVDVGIEGLPVTEGFQLLLGKNPPELNCDTIRSYWSRKGIYNFRFFNVKDKSKRLEAADYLIIFDTVGVDTSKRYQMRLGPTWWPARPVNFKIINRDTGKKVPFAFLERDTRIERGRLTISRDGVNADQIFMLTPLQPGLDSLVPSWSIYLKGPADTTSADTLLPDIGDTLFVYLNRPFLSNDMFEFTMVSGDIDNALAKSELDKIRVVPNPYVISNPWEPRNPYRTGRGERQLHFIHLPAKCLIRIFTVSGQLVKTIVHESPYDNGTAIWNMLTKDNLEIGYGIYIYHVYAEGVGEKIGKFLVLK